MSRNFRASQLLDAFDFSSNDILEQLRATFTNVHSGTTPPANTLGQDGNIYFDTTAMILYVREVGDWVAASSQGGGSVSLTALLDQLAAESLYTYTPVDANDYIAASGDSFYDGTNLVLTFRAGYTVPQSLYGFMTAPTGATGDEPDLVIHLLRTGITISGNTTYYFAISRGTVTNFEFAQMLSDIPMILQNLYTRGAGSNPQEYLTKTANGDYEFTQLVIPPPQQLRLNQVASWPEGLTDRTFDSVQIGAAGAITFANNADASDFFNDLGPAPREGGGFITSSLVVLIEDAMGTPNVRLLAPTGTPVGIVNNIVTFTGATTVATSLPITVTEVRGSQFEGSVNGVFDIPVSYLATSTGNNLTLTIPATDADRYNNFRRVLSVLPTGRFAIANDEDGTKAFYTVALNTNDATNVILDLTALSSIASGGQVGLEGRTTPAFNFTLPTTGNVDVFNIGNVEARTNRFIDHHDTPTTYNGRANQLVRVNSTGTGLEFFEQTFDPIATITPTTAPNNEVDWTPLNEYDAVLFNNENLQPTQTVAGATNSQFTGTQRVTRNDGTINPFLATLINAVPDGDLTLTNGDYYTITFEDPGSLIQNLNGQILIFRAENITGNNLPQTFQVTTQRFLNDNIGTASVGHSGDIPVTIRHYPAADVDLATFNRDAVDLSVTTGSQTVNISGFSDATPGINARIASGDRIFLRIDNGADDTYLEVLSADSSAVVVNLAEKFTVDARNFTSRATDTRRIILDPNASDTPVHNELYEHEVTQAGIPAITDVNGLPVLQADITAEEVKTLLEVDEAAIIDNAGGAPTLAPNVTADGIKNLLDLQLDDLSDVTITPTGTDFMSVANPIDADNSAAGDYTTADSTFEIIFQNAGARAGFTVGLRVAFTLATTALADVPSNILFTGTITISEQNLNLGERIVMTVDSRYRSFFTGGTFTASADGFTVPAATIETWRAWSFTDSDLGVGVFDVHGDLSNQSITDFRARLNILEPAIIDNAGTPALDNDITAAEVRDLLNVDIESGDQVTFTTGFDPNDRPLSHTYPGVTTSFGGQSGTDPNVATFTFATQSDAFAFFALTGARSNNGTSTRAVTVTYGSVMLGFPVGTMMGPGGGNDLEVLNRSVITGGLAVQTTPTDFVIAASETLPVHVTSNLFDLEGTGGIDIDIDPAMSRITINGSASTNSLTFVADDELNTTGTARSFGNVEVITAQSGSTEFSFTNTGDADEFRAQFLTRAGSTSTVPITVQYVDDARVTITVTVPVGTAVTPYDTDNNVLVFYETGFTNANNTSLNLEDLVPDTIHTNELHITSPTSTIQSDVLVVNNNDTLELDVADGAITPNRIALETGQSHAPGNLLVTGPRNTDFSTTPFRNLVPHAFSATDQFITWDSRCTFSEGSIDRDGVTVTVDMLSSSTPQATLNAFGIIETAGSRQMSSGIIGFLNGLSGVTYESDRMYVVQFVPASVSTAPTTLGDTSIIDALPGVGGVADLTNGQILVFRTGAIAPATGDLPTNQEWANDNLNIANFNWNQDVRIIIRDYSNQNVEARANEAFLLSENTHVTIPLRTTLTPESILAFNTARGTESPMHDVYTSLPAPNGNVLIRIFSVNTNEVVLDRSAQLIDDQDGTFTQANLTGRIKMSPTNQNLLTFSPHNAQDTVYVARNSSEETHANILQRISTTEEIFSNGTLTIPVHGTLNSREVHRISGAGTRADSFTPQELQFTLTVPTDYEVATTGSTLGTLYRRAVGNTPVQITFAIGNSLFIDSPLGTDDRSRLEGARISPNPNGFPETTIVGRPGATINVNDGSIFNTNDQIYVVTDVNPTIVLFDLAGGPFGTLGDTTVVTTADLTLMPRMTAAAFLTELGRVIRLTWPTVTIDTAARANPTDSTLTEIIINTNQTGGITLNFALNDTEDESAVTMTAAGTTIGSQFRVSFADPMVTNRNFSIDIADTQTRTLTQLLDTIAMDIARETPDGWTTTREGNDIVLVSVLPTPSTALVTTSVTNAGDGDITLSSTREIQGGRRAVAIGNGLNVSDTGVISTTQPAFGVVSATVGREDTANINSDGTLTINTSPDPGDQSQAFVNQLFATNPTQGDLVNIPTDKDNYLILIARNDVIFIPRGTLISYVNSTALVTLGTTLQGQAIAIGTNVELRDALSFEERIDLFAGPGIQFETSAADDSLTIRTRSATNPTTDALNFEAVVDVQNSAVRFADWLLTNGFGFPERGSGTITISDNNPTTSGFSYYEINGQNYYYIDELNSGSWIVGIVTDGTTYTTAQLNPRTIISFGT